MTRLQDQRRHGRFNVREDQWADPEFAAAVLTLCVPYDIKRSGYLNGLEVFAYARGECFREVPDNTMIPEYGMHTVLVLPDAGPSRVMFEAFAEGVVNAQRVVRA